MLIALLLIGGGCKDKTLAERIAAGHQAGAAVGAITITYPLDGTLFPPEIGPPTLRFVDPTPGVDSWLLSVEPGDGKAGPEVLLKGRAWRPDEAQWARIKAASKVQPARVRLLGVAERAPDHVLSAGKVQFSTATAEVGAPLFYREVNLPFLDAVKDPSKIRWRFGPISARERPPVVLEGLPVCGNCHSFSRDGKTLGMDVDYANDKGSYAIAETGKHMTLEGKDIITWSDFRREDGVKTFGLLSQVSPDGRYVVSTVKDRSIFVARPELAYSQLFFPLRGILAIYDRQTRTFSALPGADDPKYVQSNPTWSPDGQTIVFARAPAYTKAITHNKVLLSSTEAAEFLIGGKRFRFDLYAVPFAGGKGGEARALAGASNNGASNYFPRFSPDGKWIVYTRSDSFMLLQPDSALYIMPAAGGTARRMRCNTPRMNSWHSWSPDSRWLVFSTKVGGPYTQMALTHIDAQGMDTPAVLLDHMTAPDRAANIPEFVALPPDAIAEVRERFVNAESHLRAGFEHLKAGDIDQATEQYRKAVETDPQNAVAQENLGLGLARQGKVLEAIRCFERALALAPDRPAAHANMGAALAQMNRFLDALPYFERAVALAPDDPEARNNLGAALKATGRYDEAMAQFEAGARLAPDVDIFQAEMADIREIKRRMGSGPPPGGSASGEAAAAPAAAAGR